MCCSAFVPQVKTTALTGRAALPSPGMVSFLFLAVFAKGSKQHTRKEKLQTWVSDMWLRMGNNFAPGVAISSEMRHMRLILSVRPGPSYNQHVLILVFSPSWLWQNDIVLFRVSANCSLLCTSRKWCVPRVGVEGDACLALHPVSRQTTCFSAAVSRQSRRVQPLHSGQTPASNEEVKKMDEGIKGWEDVSPTSSLKLQQLVQKSVTSN